MITYYAYILCGVTAVLAAGGTFLMAHPQADQLVGRVLHLYRVGFTCLAPLASLPFIPEHIKPTVILLLIGLAASGVGCLAWALRELVVGPLKTGPAVILIFIAGLLIVASGLFLTPKTYALITSGTYTLIGVVSLLDQMRGAMKRLGWDQPTRSERMLMVNLLLYVGIFGVTSLHTLAQDIGSKPDYGFLMPSWLMPFAMTFISILPLMVAGTAFSVLNERLIKKLEDIALTDALTGVFSRRGLNELGPILTSKYQRQGTSVAVLMVDIDHFKKINDLHGHATGDMALKHVGTVLQKFIRGESIVARYGGEEFTVLLPILEIGEAQEAAERLRAAISETPFATQGGAIKLTASIGVAQVLPNDDLGKAIESADACLYQAKRDGRNRVVAVNEMALA